MWICAAETARARGKASRSTVLLTVLGTSSLLVQAANPIGAPPSSTQLPTGGQVVAGQANISQAGSAMTVQQGSDRAAIDWQTFNLGSQASINFQQPSTSSVTLNRVLDANPSQIYGRLSANGHVFLSNPNGVYFAPSANVDVGGIVATTMGISNDDFMAGRDVFQRNGSTGAVLNLGRMQAAPGGVIALLAPEVRNEGVLVAQAGTVAMASGEAITLHFGATSGLLDITVTPSQVRALVENRHAVLAEGGQIILAARAADGLLASVIHSGELNASSIVEKGGRVFIEAKDITLAAGSRIEATGATGGGQVLVGGQPKGAGDMYQATTVTMAAGASIDASATQQGDGGTVVLWSNVHDASAKTTVQGTIAARGGAQGGNGGFVETSGASLKIDDIRVDTSAATGTAGQTGEWLLDPYDLTVDASAASTISTNLGTSNVTLLTTASGASGPGVQNANGNGDITVNSAIGWSSGNRLTLDAYRNVNINAAISAGNNGKVTIITGDTAGNGTSTSAVGDYSFGLGAGGFAGRLTFGSVAGSAALQIGTGGTGAPVSYSLVYTQAQLAALNGQSGNYALANALTTSGSYTAATPGAASMIGSFGNSSTKVGTFTGLGNTLSGYTVTHNTGTNTNGPGGYALFGTNNGTIRDFGVVGAVLTTNTFANNSGTGLLAGANNGGTLKNDYTTGTIAMANATGFVGGLVGLMNTGTVANSWSSATINAPGQSLGGLIGSIVTTASAGALVTDSYATGNVTSTSLFSTGGLIGSINPGAGSVLGTTVRNSYATGNVSSPREYTGGLIGLIQGGTSASHNLISNSYATGSVNSTNTGTGGLVGNASGFTDFADTYATGNVTTNNSGAGGLIGVTNNGTLTVNRSYATGNVTGTGVSAQNIGGFIGDAGATTINTSFSTGNVSAYAYYGGFVGAARSGNVWKDVYANGNVSGNATAGSSLTAIGGLLGYASGATSITNAYSSGTTPAYVVNSVGASVGQGNNQVTLTNVYWDSTKAGSNGYGNTPGTVSGGGARTTAQLRDGTMPTGFNSGNTANSNPWRAGYGLNPYFALAGYVPAGAQTISGTAYTAGGAAAGSSLIDIYFGGGVLASGITADAMTGAYTAFVGAGTIGAGSHLGGTLKLSGAGNISGLTYTDMPTFTGGNVTGFDLKSGLLLATTADTTNSALQTNLGATFGSGAFSTLATTLASARWQYNASGNFTVDSAISHGSGDLGLSAGGNLAINSTLTAGTNLFLKAAGNVTEATSGAGLTATNLVLLGGAVALNSANVNGTTSSNNVATLTGTGLASLSYLDADTLTIGNVGPFLDNVTATSINGTSTSSSGLSAAGNMFVGTASFAGNLNVSGNITTTAGTPGATLTLRAGQNVSIADGVSIASGGSGKLNTVLWTGWNTSLNRGTLSVGNASIDTNGGFFWAGGGASNDGASGVTSYQGITVPALHATQFQVASAPGALFNGTTVTTRGGLISIKGRFARPSASGNFVGLSLQGVTLNAGGGNIDLAGVSSLTGTSLMAVQIAGNTAITTTGSGNITITGTDTSTNGVTGTANGIQLASTGSQTITLQTDSGNISLNGSSTSSTATASAGLQLSVAAPSTGRINIVSNSGDITLSGSQGSGRATAGIEGLQFSADGAANVGAVRWAQASTPATWCCRAARSTTPRPPTRPAWSPSRARAT
ncbi:hypothetical protein COAQ111491_09110 [Comamonas aquatilis]